ncbi:MAG TPA: CHAT domain-containing protein, partial [bacterium]|nr:CHAT domain-containing protein [bacterium]
MSKLSFQIFIFGFIITFTLQSQTENDSFKAAQSHATAQTYLKGLKYDSAIVFLKDALKLYIKTENWKKAGTVYDEITYGQRISGFFMDATATATEGLALVKSKLGDSNIVYGELLNTYATVLWSRGLYDSSLNINRRNLKLRTALLGPDHQDVGAVHTNIGLAYKDKGYYEEALSHYEKGLKIRIKALGENHSSIASSYINMGVIYRIRGDYKTAEELYLKALNIRIKTIGEKHPRTAIIYFNIGICYDAMGDYERAMMFYRKAIDVALSTLGPEHPDVSDMYIGIAICYYNQGMFHESLEYEKKALVIRLKRHDPSSVILAINYNNIGNVFRELKQIDSAEYYYQLAFTINKREYGSHSEVAKGYVYFGDIAERREHWREADSLFTLGLNMAKDVLGFKNPLVAEILSRHASLAKKTNDITAAIRLSQAALNASLIGFNDSNILSNPTLKDATLESVSIEILAQKARLWHQLFLTKHDVRHMEESFKLFELVSGWIDYLRQGYRLEGSKIFLGTKAKRIYEEGIRACVTAYRATQAPLWIERAFTLSQRSKSGALREALHDLQIRNFTQMPDSVSNLERDIKINLASYETQLQNQLQLHDSSKHSEIQRLERIIFYQKAQYDSLQNWIEQNNPEYFKLKYKSTIPTIAEIQHTLKKDAAVLIDYFTGDSITTVITVTATRISMQVLHNDTTLESSVRIIRKHVNNLASDELSQSSYSFYKRWVQPSLQSVKLGATLVIIPDGSLSYLPFETLVTSSVSSNLTSKVRYLCQDFPIQYVFSADRIITTSDKTPTNAFFGFAPVFSDTTISGYIKEYQFDDSTMSSHRGFFTRGTHFAQLPHSQTEVTNIQELFSNRKFNSKIVTHQKAVKSVLTSDSLTNYGFIHLASHGFINEANPKLSGIALYSDDSVDVKEDVLYAGEIYNLRLNAHLVTLSACKTALGK